MGQYVYYWLVTELVWDRQRDFETYEAEPNDGGKSGSRLAILRSLRAMSTIPFSKHAHAITLVPPALERGGNVFYLAWS